MLYRSFKMQFLLMTRNKLTISTFIGLFTLVLVNYFNNVFTYSGKDIIDMVHPMKLLTLSWNSSYGFYFMQYYPLLVILPAGFTYLVDRNANILPFIKSKVGTSRYYFGKLLAVFLITFLVLTVPFLSEIILNCSAFPLQASGDPSNLYIYDQSYIGWVNRYILVDLYHLSPYLYAICFVLLIGLASGILAVFTVAISTLPVIKYWILVFLPVYSLLYIVSNLKNILHTTVETNYFYYLRLFETGSKTMAGYLILLLCLLAISIFITSYKMKKDLFR